MAVRNLGGPVEGFEYGYGLNYFWKGKEGKIKMFDSMFRSFQLSVNRNRKTYGGFDSLMARSLVCFMLMLGLMLVLSITTGANDSLAANNHALICHVINGCQPGVNATMCSISTKTISESNERK